MSKSLLPLLLFLLSILSANTTHAQTANEPNEGSRLVRDETTGDYTFKWWGHSGQTYFVQCSDDLVHWSYASAIESGADAVIEYGFTCTSDHFFLRLRYTDADSGGNPDTADFDGDGLTNAEEVAASGPQTDPFSADTDTDGMSDGWEVANGFSPISDLDANDDPDNDGTVNLIEYMLRTDPHVADTNSGDPFLTGAIISPLGAQTSGASLINNTSGVIPFQLLSAVRYADLLWSPNFHQLQHFGSWYNNGNGQTWFYNLTSFPILYSMETYLASKVPFPYEAPATSWAEPFDPQDMHWIYATGSSGGASIEDWRYWLKTSSTQSTDVQYSAVNRTDYFLQYTNPSNPSQTTPVQVLHNYKYQVATIYKGKTTSTPIDGLTPLYWHVSPGSGYSTQTYNYTIFQVPAQISWEAKYNNLADHYDPFSGVQNGVALYPDASTPTGSLLREVRVKVFVPGYARRTVYLKAFDVDDPSTVYDPYGVLDPTDGANYRAGDDNLTAPTLASYGIFLPSLSKQTSITLDQNGYGSVDFKVTQQPGNNYRIAVAVNQNDLNFLQVANSNSSGYVAPNSTQAAGFNGAITPMLTVWRRLNVEVDSMQWYTGNKPSPDRAIATGDYWTGNQLHLSTPVPIGGSFYNGGHIELNGHSYPIWGSLSADSLLIGGGGTALGTGQVIVYDDDDTGLPTPRLPNLFGVITSGVKAKFKKAFIDVVPMAGAYNPITTIPFNVGSDHGVPWTDLDDSKNSGAASFDNLEYWCHYLMVAYQPTQGRSNDGPISDGSYQGVTVWGGFMPTEFSAIYEEVVRDKETDRTDPLSGNFILRYLERHDNVVAHEIGHLP